MEEGRLPELKESWNLCIFPHQENICCQVLLRWPLDLVHLVRQRVCVLLGAILEYMIIAAKPPDYSGIVLVKLSQHGLAGFLLLDEL